MRLTVLLLFAHVPFVLAQDATVRVTAQTLSPKTSSAMFGRLPKSISVVSVQVCSDSSSALIVPLARVLQQVIATHGYTILPKDAASVVIAAAQARSPLQRVIRIASGVDAGVQGLIVAKLIATNTVWGSVLITAGNILQIDTPIALQTIPATTYLTFADEMLPDPMVLAALGCQSGYALAEVNTPSVKRVDFEMPMPAMIVVHPPVLGPEQQQQ